jgi:hypothetical protein
MKTMYRRNNIFHSLAKIDGEKVFTPMCPQPSPHTILQVHRYYWKLKADDRYTKRVTWIEMERELPPLLCVEYLGLYPGLIPHGNSKRKAQAYKRTAGKFMQKIKENVKNQPPRHAYQDLILQAKDSTGRPRNSKQVRNQKYFDNRHREENRRQPLANVADHMVAIQNMAREGDSLVRKVIISSGNVPTIILYTDEQISDIRRFCCSGPNAASTVFGVDKTYNLGEMFVTVSCFKHLAVTRINTGGNPLFFGPIMIHARSTFSTYCDYFSEIRIALGRCIGQPIIGSDDETAIKNAIASCFPEARSLSCIRHLKQNVSDYLSQKIGVKESDIKRIKADLFGPQGVESSENAAVFFLRTQEATRTVQRIAPAYVPHLQNRIIPLLRSNFDVVTGAAGFPNLRQWTNNNCESMNHVLKLAIQWKPQALVNLVQRIRKEIQSQYTEIEMAIVGQGNFRLCNEYKNFSTNEAAWLAKTSHERKLQDFKLERNRLHKTYPFQVMGSQPFKFPLPVEENHVKGRDNEQKGHLLPGIETFLSFASVHLLLMD